MKKTRRKCHRTGTIREKKDSLGMENKLLKLKENQQKDWEIKLRKFPRMQGQKTKKHKVGEKI